MNRTTITTTTTIRGGEEEEEHYDMKNAESSSMSIKLEGPPPSSLLELLRINNDSSVSARSFTLQIEQDNAKITPHRRRILYRQQQQKLFLPQTGPAWARCNKNESPASSLPPVLSPKVARRTISARPAWDNLNSNNKREQQNKGLSSDLPLTLPERQNSDRTLNICSAPLDFNPEKIGPTCINPVDMNMGSLLMIPPPLIPSPNKGEEKGAMDKIVNSEDSNAFPEKKQENYLQELSHKNNSLAEILLSIQQNFCSGVDDEDDEPMIFCH